MSPPPTYSTAATSSLLAVDAPLSDAPMNRSEAASILGIAAILVWVRWTTGAWLAQILMALPSVTACYVGEKVWEHRRHWYVVPKGWRLPKVEVACLASAVVSLFLGALILA